MLGSQGFIFLHGMGLFLYNLFIALYSFLIRVVSLFNKKAKLFITGRKGGLARIAQYFSDNTAPVAWFHVASLGEFEQAKPVMEAFREKYPNHKLFITFFSPSGYELRKDYQGADCIAYLPVDTSRNARQLLNAVNPSLVVFVKYEFWYHYLNEANQRKIPLYCVSALFTPNHIFFKPYGGLHRRMLGFFDHLFVQNEQSAQLLAGIGLAQVSISGDTRFDRVVKTLADPERYPVVEAFKGSAPVMVIGSSWPSDMVFLYDIINKSVTDLKFVIAPHEVHESSVSQLEKGLERKSVRITQASEAEAAAAEVLIVDTIGMLSSIYQYGSFAYIGGAFGDGLHNILEAVTFGLPVIFGNKGLEKFPESLELQGLGGAFSFGQKEELLNIYQRLSTDEAYRKAASAVCKTYIREHTGATERIMAHLHTHYEGKGN